MISQNAYAKAVPPLGAKHHQKSIQGFVKEFVYLLPKTHPELIPKSREI